MNQILTDEELWDIHCKEDDTVFAYGRGVIAAYETKLREQNEPIYQLRCRDGTWIDQNEQSYKYNLEHGHTVRKLYEHPAPSAQEGWQQFSHTLKYLIGTWRDGKGMFPQGSDKYDESIATAHLLLKEADWQQGRYFPILAAARSVE